MLVNLFLFFYCSIYVLILSHNPAPRSDALNGDKMMDNWHNAGRFLGEFLALGTLFVSAYITMML